MIEWVLALAVSMVGIGLLITSFFINKRLEHLENHDITNLLRETCDLRMKIIKLEKALSSSSKESNKGETKNE